MNEGNVYLIGFMGAGKSTVAPKLAAKLDKEWIDTDDRVEDRKGMSIPEIFEYYGEDRFREIETDVIREISKKEGIVVAVGGGAPMRGENWKAMQSSGEIVYLEVSPKEIMERVGNDGTRPLLADLKQEEKKDKVRRMLKERHPRYSKADHIILCDGVGTEAVAGEVFLKLDGHDEKG